ncbi:hypothetical protein [Paenibacillus planticolens]|uniref:hypothetical protein n=1 Tax=Paenibacillus planticolens TaxID=2654976 RepID=UPI0014921576|nr:hypothetical protein [Paenibacillus planticolens]
MNDVVTRKGDAKPAKARRISRQAADLNAWLQYNGGCRDYEDPADYLPRLSLRGVVIA